jgi:hypothetical protein
MKLFEFMQINRLLGTDLANQPGVQFCASGSVLFCLHNSQRPIQVVIDGVVTRIGHKHIVFQLDWIWSTVPSLSCIDFGLQITIGRQIIFWRDHYVTCAVLGAISHTTFRFAIREIFVSLGGMGIWYKKFAGFWQWANRYLSYHISGIWRWKRR